MGFTWTVRLFEDGTDAGYWQKANVQGVDPSELRSQTNLLLFEAFPRKYQVRVEFSSC